MSSFILSQPSCSSFFSLSVNHSHKYVQAVIQMIGVACTLLLMSGSKGPDMVAISSGAVGFISLILGELGWQASVPYFSWFRFCFYHISCRLFNKTFLRHGVIGRRRSWVSLLRAYMVGSTVATLLSIICVFKGNLSLEVRCFTLFHDLIYNCECLWIIREDNPRHWYYIEKTRKQL